MRRLGQIAAVLTVAALALPTSAVAKDHPAHAGVPRVAPTTAVPPANDNLADAASIGTAATACVLGSSAGATLETNEPHAGFYDAHSVWYTWVAPSGDSVDISVFPDTLEDSTLGVYTGTEVGSLTPIAWNDDLGNGDWSSSVTFTPTSGETYRIRVAGYDWSFQGSFGLEIGAGTCEPPANDDIANAATISALPYSDSRATIGATRETGEPHIGNYYDGDPATVWYTWTPSTYGNVVVGLETSLGAAAQYGATFVVYSSSGSGFASLTKLQEGWPENAVHPPVHVEAGTTYYIQVAGEQGERATISLTVSDPPPTLALEQWSGQPDPTDQTPIRFVFSSTDDLLDQSTITGADFQAYGGEITYGPGCGVVDYLTSCALQVTPDGDGPVSIGPSAAFSVTDMGHHVQTHITDGDRTVDYDTTAPNLTLEQNASQADPTNTGPIYFTLLGNEALAAGSVTESDFVPENGTISDIQCDGSSCLIGVDPTAEGTVQLGPDPSTFSVTDVLGHAQTEVGGEDRSVVYDLTAPTLSLYRSGGASTNQSPVYFTLWSNEDLNGSSVEAGDFSVANGSVTGIECTGVSCVISVTPEHEGNVEIGKGTFAVEDAAGNSTSSVSLGNVVVSYDTTAPSFTWLSTRIQGSKATITFSVGADSILTTCALDDWEFVACSGTWVSTNIPKGDRVLHVRRRDAAGNEATSQVPFTIKSGKYRALAGAFLAY